MRTDYLLPHDGSEKPIPMKVPQLFKDKVDAFIEYIMTEAGVKITYRQAVLFLMSIEKPDQTKLKEVIDELKSKKRKRKTKFIFSAELSNAQEKPTAISSYPSNHHL